MNYLGSEPYSCGFQQIKQLDREPHARYANDSTERTSRARKSFDIFLSVLSQVVLSDDEEDDDDWSIISEDINSDPKAPEALQHASGHSAQSSCCNSTQSVAMVIPKETDVRNMVQTFSSLQEGQQENEENHKQGRKEPQYLDDEKTILIEDDGETPEDPLPHFLEKVDALSRLSVSESTIALSRSRDSFARLTRRRSTLSDICNVASSKTVTTSPPRPRACWPHLHRRRSMDGSFLGVARRAEAGAGGFDMPPSLPSREDAGNCSSFHLHEQQYQRSLSDYSVMNRTKGLDLSPRMPTRRSVQIDSSFHNTMAEPEESSESSCEEESQSDEDDVSIELSSSDDENDDESTIYTEG
ncbi:hypothetical protein ACA910_002034 [Epithemia clementina (nom. ined.)]